MHRTGLTAPTHLGRNRQDLEAWRSAEPRVESEFKSSSCFRYLPAEGTWARRRRGSCSSLSTSSLENSVDHGHHISRHGITGLGVKTQVAHSIALQDASQAMHGRLDEHGVLVERRGIWRVTMSGLPSAQHFAQHVKGEA